MFVQDAQKVCTSHTATFTVVGRAGNLWQEPRYALAQVGAEVHWTEHSRPVHIL